MAAKLILQDAWQNDIGWDESLPQDLHERWLNFRQQLPHLHELRIPRRVKFSASMHHVQLHGFCDASQQAYGACIYISTDSDSEQPKIGLLCSKSRVAPIKAVTLPRLELCAAVIPTVIPTRGKGAASNRLTRSADHAVVRLHHRSQLDKFLLS